MNPLDIKSQFIEEKDAIFNDPLLQKNAYKLTLEYSILVEEYIIRIIGKRKASFALASVGSFSRRELSPHSDIDVMFISDNIEENENHIQEVVRELWDCGIEISHTVRTLFDIKKFLEEDLHAFTQFFETRFLFGNSNLYKVFTERAFSLIDADTKKGLLKDYFTDTKYRYKKYGDSPKVLEPNIKFSAGGLRDVQIVEWMYSLSHNVMFTNQNEITQTEEFFNTLEKQGLVDLREINRLRKSYKLLLNVRNVLHLISKRKNDRLEFGMQEKIAPLLPEYGGSLNEFMKNYFKAANVINRFSKTMTKRFSEQITKPISDYLAIELDDDFILKGRVISIKENKPLSMSDILRAFYYRGVNNGRFDENLRSLIIQSTEKVDDGRVERESSVFFREIMKMQSNISATLITMNELGVLGAFLPEFYDMIGFFQPGVYHCYTADEHTLIALRNLENVFGDDSHVGRLYTALKNKDILHLAVLFHDIAKPLSVSGHEIIGSEIAASIMERLGYDNEEVDMVRFLVKYHLLMEQVAFRRNLNDAATLDSFAAIFDSVDELNMLYLLTFADLSAVNSSVWTTWKAEQLHELYRKAKHMIEDRISGDELLLANTLEIIERMNDKSDEHREHVDSINDVGYFAHFTKKEIDQHIDEITKGVDVTVFFKKEDDYTNVTIITRDTNSLMAKLCGAISINDLNIHDARIFTRKDGIVIDSFNITDYRTQGNVNEERYKKLERDIKRAVRNELQINNEISKLKSKWWRLENKIFRRKSKIKIGFESHEKYTIIDVSAPDKVGMLYQITRKMSDLGLSLYFAKISTKGDDIVDSFYVLDRNGEKVSPHDYEMISIELNDVIEDML